MSETDLSRLPFERIEAEIASLSREIAIRMERWLGLVAEFDRRDGARRSGFRSTAEWLAWRCGLSHRTAVEHVRVARALVERPLIRECLATGELSYSKVRAISRAPMTEDEAGLVSLARTSTAGEVERVVRALRSAPSADVDVANAAFARRFVNWSWELDGSLSIRARLPAEDGAAFIEMIETGAAGIHGTRTPPDDASGDLEPASAPDRPPWGACRADALAEVARSGSPRTQVVVHVDRAALACTATGADDRAGEICELESGPAIPSETARRLSCDADLILARAGGDGAIDFGRSHRNVSPSQRKRLERRDRRCRFPGCERRHGLQPHHVVHWAHGGPTDDENLIMLCPFHHRMVHEGGFTAIRARDRAIEFIAPDHRVIRQVPIADDPTGRPRGQPIAA